MADSDIEKHSSHRVVSRPALYLYMRLVYVIRSSKTVVTCIDAVGRSI